MMHRAHRDAFLSSLRDVEWRGLSHTYAICVPVMGGGGCVCVCVGGGGGGGSLCGGGGGGCRCVHGQGIQPVCVSGLTREFFIFMDAAETERFVSE